MKLSTAPVSRRPQKRANNSTSKFSLRPSAYLCHLCVEITFNAEKAEIRRGPLSISKQHVQFFKRKLLYPPNNKKPDTNVKSLHDAYREHLRSIKSKLPDGAWKLACHSFHDATVVSVSRPSRRELVIILKGGYAGSGYDFINDQLLDGRFTRLHFSGVKQDWVPDTIVGDVWLNEEMTLSELARFDYQALLWKDEIRIQADDVLIEANDNLTLLT